VAAGVAVTMLSPEVPAEFPVDRIRGRWPEDAPPLDGFDLVFAATNDREVNRSVTAAGRAAGKLVNVADEPEEGDFFTVATVKAGKVLISLSTEGASPALTAQLRAAMELWLAEHPELTGQ
jgi:siroheme synthase-like protein